MTVLIKRRYSAVISPELTLHVFDQVDEVVSDNEDEITPRITYVETVDERNDGYEVETITLDDDGLATLHGILSEMLGARSAEQDDACAF